MTSPVRSLFCLSLLATLGACKSGPTPEKLKVAIADTDYFVRYIKPIFAMRCVSCHEGVYPPAGLSLVQRSGLYAPRKRNKAYVVPGDPSASLLLTAIEPGGSHPRTTPLVAGGLSDYEMGALYEWIEDGAHWPDNPNGFVYPLSLIHRTEPLE
ncbi:MAG: c-type cytochrome domain-containing protein [Verrucomicrobiota bacterium]